jgi:integrase/recombinase XerC
VRAVATWRRESTWRAWDDLTSAYLVWLAAIGRPNTTRELRRFQLAYLGKTLDKPPALVSFADLIEWFAAHSDWSPETRRSYRSAVRSFFAWAVAERHLDADPAAGIPQIRVPVGQPRPAAEVVYRAALGSADSRTGLMLRLAAEAGLRRAEIAKVHTRDLRCDDAGRPQLLVHGKGDKDRVVPITEGLAALIALGAAGHSLGLPSRGWLFPSDRGGHVSPAWVGELCSQALGPEATLHQLRHRFASRAYRGTRNLRAVQGLLGHANVATTERYTACDDDERRAAMMAAAAAE